MELLIGIAIGAGLVLAELYRRKRKERRQQSKRNRRWRAHGRRVSQY